VFTRWTYVTDVRTPVPAVDVALKSNQGTEFGSAVYAATRVPMTLLPSVLVHSGAAAPPALARWWPIVAPVQLERTASGPVRVQVYVVGAPDEAAHV
jgi:hypothetical protein